MQAAFERRVGAVVAALVAALVATALVAWRLRARLRILSCGSAPPSEARGGASVQGSLVDESEGHGLGPSRKGFAIREPEVADPEGCCSPSERSDPHPPTRSAKSGSASRGSRPSRSRWGGPPTGTPLVVVSDAGQDLDDEMSIVMMRNLQSRGLVNLCGIVATLSPAFDRALLIRGTLDMLGLHDVPVGVGSDGGCHEHERTSFQATLSSSPQHPHCTPLIAHLAPPHPAPRTRLSAARAGAPARRLLPRAHCRRPTSLRASRRARSRSSLGASCCVA